MRTFLTLVLGLLVLVAVALGGAWVWAGTQPAPTIHIRQPGALIGQATSLDLMVETPGGKLSSLSVTVEQQGKSLPVYALAEAPSEGGAPAEQFYVMRPLGKQALPQLQAGPARIVVHAARPVLYGLRTLSATATKDVTVRLEPPQVSVLSTKNYVNIGGAEFVVFRATPADVEAGVKVGERRFPAFPASGVGIPGDASTRVAFFALPHDADVNVPIVVFARDAAGNEATTPLDHETFPKPFLKSRIEVDDRFLGRVVPAIIAGSPGLSLSTAPSDVVNSFVAINSDVRKKNGETIAGLAKTTAPKMLWNGPFEQLGNSKVESRFADSRTYVYKGKEIDHQTHLGFDLAVTANVPIASAQSGVVAWAAYLGIYGNCVIVDHGLGVHSLYAHLTSIDVKPGATVEKGQILGRSGMTGLAGGDHLHFTMLLDGQAVNPVEWWDLKWMTDRVLRKIAEAGGPAVAAAPAAAASAPAARPRRPSARRPSRRRR